MTKIKVLFVVAGFYRAGAERFAYELDRVLDKEKFDLTIFCLEKVKDINPVWKIRYYEDLHKQLGTKIKYADEFIDYRYTEQGRIRNKIKKYLGLFPKNPSFWNEDLSNYLDEFDVIHWMGEYIYINSVSDSVRKKSLIYTMTARFQKRTLYDNFNHELYYNFCTGFKKEELKYELEQFKNYHSVFVPLFMKIDEKKRRWKFQNSSIKKIGIFTRLDPFKPLDPFFYSFQLLLDRLPNCELHIFGNGDPIQTGMTQSLERIGMQDKVFFRGHQEDITDTAIDEKLDLSWFQGYNNDRPAGYAGFDICTTGVPLLCWDFKPNPNEYKNPVYPHYKNLNQFVAKTIEILTDHNKAEDLSEKQYNDVLKTRSAVNHIKTIEAEYERIFNLKY
ncbi:hypothetical protein [uncultured Chryseobacterium sp.]|uniref:hypothetical protein n=1 Tax=uncultured Chryseobacterium sp. TaxID=259322 RepID=UPI003749F1D3